MDAAAVVAKAKDAGVHLVSFLYCDNAGIIRTKSTHVSALAGRMTSGIGFTKAQQAVRDGDVMETVTGMGPVGEFRLIPDPSTFQVLPYAPKRAMMLGDMMTLEGEPWPACPRDFLKRMIARAAGMGLKIVASFEPEWYLAKKEGDAFVPVDESPAFSGTGMTAPMAVIDDLLEALSDQGLQVEIYHPEAGWGQQEVSIRHAEALRAADNHVMYRETVRNVAWSHGYYASFAPKPYPDQLGNGCHIHISAWDLPGERNLFFESDKPYALGETGSLFLGGLMEHLRPLLALTAPSVNSYRRLVPNLFATAYNIYGPDNREAAVRIPSTLKGSEEGSVNLEYKPADSSANPYIALGGMIAAGLDGIERKLRPDEALMVDVDPATIPEAEFERRGIRRLPEDLSVATRELESDPVLLDAMGPMLAESYLAIRWGEWRLFSVNDVDFELKRHFYKY